MKFKIKFGQGKKSLDFFFLFLSMREDTYCDVCVCWLLQWSCEFVKHELGVQNLTLLSRCYLPGSVCECKQFIWIKGWLKNNCHCVRVLDQTQHTVVLYKLFQVRITIRIGERIPGASCPLPTIPMSQLGSKPVVWP